MKKWVVVAVGICLFSLPARSEKERPPVQGDRLPIVSVLGDNVNLRARPTLASETVGQVSRPEKLAAKSFIDEWVEVEPPSSVDLWVLGDYVRNGVIDGDNVNVRAGAGINFNIVGQLDSGAEVTVRGELGQWVSIKPPDGSSLWIHASLVELAPARQPVEEIPVLEEAEEADALEIELERWKRDMLALEKAELKAAAEAPAGLDLIPSPVQGQKREYQGTLRPRRHLFGSPSRHRLVVYDEGGRETTICFVKGRDEQLDKLFNRRMVVHGREYWVVRSEYPVIVPDRIVLKIE